MQRSKSFSSSSFAVRRRRALGQHLLVSGKVAEKMIEYAGTLGTDIVYEIGTGTGFLTGRIARVARNVVSFEIDKGLFEIAKARLSKFENVKLELGDAFSLPNRVRFDLCLSSLPYSRSLEFAEWIAKRESTFRCAVLLVQKEFAEKLLAAPGSRNYRAVSVICQASFAIELLETVMRNAFNPPPSVLSCIIRLTPKKDVHLDSTQIALIKNIFSFRGRMMRPALKKMGLLDRWSKLIPEDFLTSRVEKLTPPDFLRIAKLLAK